MTETKEFRADRYAPILEGPFTPESREEIQAQITAHRLDYIKTQDEAIYRIRGKLNAKSIPLDDSSTHLTRVTFEKVASFGTLEPAVPKAETKTEDTEPAPANHAERAHAVLSASGAYRWINCPPSARLEAELPESTSDAAEQGTAAHELGEHKIRELLGLPTTRPVSDWHDEEMERLTDEYRDYVMAEYSQARENSVDAQLLLEQRLDYSHIVPDGFGTGDVVIMADGVLTIIDLKYGAGVRVDAERNPQMMIYALGALNIFDMLYDVHTVRMTIYQPRREHVSTFELSTEELMDWADNVLKPAAELADAGAGEMRPGSWCTFCKIKNTCRARAEKNLELAQHEFKDPAQLEDFEIADILKVIPGLVSWAKALEGYAANQAINHGKHYDGFKIVTGRSMRSYTDPEKVEQAALEAGYDEEQIHKPKELLTITAMEKLMGKPKFKDTLGALVHKPEGKPILVPESDKRPEWTRTTAAEEFDAI